MKACFQMAESQTKSAKLTYEREIMTMKQVEIEHIPDTEVVYIRRVGQYGAENNALMERMKSWAAKRGLLTEDAVIYAIALDNPQSVAPEMCRYDICLHTPNIKNVETDNQVKRRVITSGKYVVFKIEHTAKAVADFWTSFPTDMAKSEYKMDFSRPIMERYRRRNASWWDRASPPTVR